MNLSIQNRLTLGSLFLYAMMMFSAVLGIVYLVRLDDEAKAVLADNYDSVRHIHGMHRELDRAATDKAKAVLGIDSLLSAQEKNITEPGEQATTALLREHFTGWKSDTASNAPLLRRDLDQLLDQNLNAIQRKSTAARRNAGHALFWLFLLTLLILLVGLGFSIAFPTVMSAPIVRLKEAVKELAAHNYRHRIPPFRMKELDELAHAFNDMAMELERYDHSNMARLMAEKNRAEAVINSLQDASIGVSDRGIILFANQRALELLGTSAETLVGQPIAEAAGRNQLLRHILSEKATAPFKAVVHGQENYFAGTSVTIQGNDRVLGQLYTLRNITPYQERDLAKTNFLATISHELKTPLASTDIGLTLLERHVTGEPADEHHAIVGDLRKDHQRLTRIVSELLDLAQAETGNIRVHMTDVSVRDLLHGAMDAVKASAQQKSIRFEVRDQDPDLRMRADADKAVWVLVNLLSNAVRHSPDGGTISITSARQDDGLLLTVTDQGPGIPPAQRDHLFQRFTRGSSTAPQGTGLGLSIAKEFMEAMGGSIAFDDRSSSGAAFVLRFAYAH